MRHRSKAGNRNMVGSNIIRIKEGKAPGTDGAAVKNTIARL